MYTSRFARLSVLTALLLIASSASAAVFPDVPDGHLFQESVEELVRAGVIDGNPDGTFAPNESVNRAAMLKMLYRARGRVPDPLSRKCASDVQSGSWYEPYVCDAWFRGDVNGYSDGTFRPGDPVNRVEALKMITTVFELPLDQVTNDNREIVNFVDVSLSAWYTQYLLTAYNKGVLPIPGQQGAHFYPDRALSRAEAAAMIYNTLNVDLTIRRQQNPPRSSAAAVTSQAAFSSIPVESDEGDGDEGDTGDTGGGSLDTGGQSGVLPTTFPFNRDGKFSAKQPRSYKVEIPSRETVHVHATMQSGQPGNMTCRLYLLGESGFSDEYFLGFQEGNSCYTTATLNPGTYQLQLQPTYADTTFSVEATTAIGDGNDGFANARSLTVNEEHEDVVGSGDFEDWFTFSLQSEQRLTVTIGNPTEIRCIVYAMSDVDLQSFSGPQCNQSYLYPPGTYYIAVGRKAPKIAQQSYVVEL